MIKQPHLSRATFSNLPLEKQEKIVAAAVAEFARHGYKKASINTIVRTAGIAKGSLYQYFRNKEELFVFIFDRFTGLVKQSVRATESGDGRDFFRQVERVLLAGMAFVDRYPDFFQIYLRVLFEQDLPGREHLLARVRLFSRDYFGPLCEAGQQSGALRPDIPAEVVLFVLDASLDRFLQSYAQGVLDRELGPDNGTILYRVDMLLRVLKEGLAVPAARR
jgi:AcrR family transcriptional regulator